MSKLVRDKIPLLCNERGETRYEFRIETDDEAYITALKDKLHEELQEFAGSGDVSELVDIATVINAILDFRKISEIEFGKMYFAKIEANGGFKNRVIMSIKS